MGLIAMTAVLAATLLGGSMSRAAAHSPPATISASTGSSSISRCSAFSSSRRAPVRLAQRSSRSSARIWRQDLFYFLINSLLVQSLTFLSLTPATEIVAHTTGSTCAAAMASQPIWLQVIEIMVLTDLTQYWVHRLFHASPSCGLPCRPSFHADDGLAGRLAHACWWRSSPCAVSRWIPMYALGFDEWALKAYTSTSYIHSTLIHANVRFDFHWLKHVIATPQFHHWHHGIEKEAIDVNFAVQFPWLGPPVRHLLPCPTKWPSGYGVGGHPVPPGYLKQLTYPFRPA